MHCARPGIPMFRGRAWCTRSFYFSFAQRAVVVVVGTNQLNVDFVAVKLPGATAVQI